MKITVITVCLNSVSTIEKTIKSVITQMCQELEYIVIDGGSTDGTLDILKKYDSYIDKMVSEPDKGIFDAMNKGIEMAAGDVIAFLNSDDWYEKEALKTIEDTFAANECDCVCCDNYVVRKYGDTVYYNATQEPIENMFFRMIYFHSAIFCKKEFFQRKNNFDLRYKIAADYDWFLQVVKRGIRIVTVHQPVFTFGYGGVSSVNEIECGREARRIALRHLPEDKAEYKERIEDRFREVVICATDGKVLRAEILKILGEEQRIVLWGAGVRGQQCAKWLKSMDIGVDFIVDSNKQQWGRQLQEINVFSPDMLENKACNLIITPDKHTEEIKSAIDKMKNKRIQVYTLKLMCKKLVENLKISK